MFGELVGLWCADLWQRAGRPAVRLGRARPGPRHARRRCAARDGQGGAGARRSISSRPARCCARRSARACRARSITTSVATLPDDRAAADRRQRILRRAADPPARPHRRRAGASGWCAMTASASSPPLGEQRFDAVDARSAARRPTRSRPRPPAVAHRCAISRGADRARRAARCSRSTMAMRARSPATRCRRCARHAFADPFAAPGEQDLTAHVDFAALAEAARGEGARRAWPVIDAGRAARRAGHRRPRRRARPRRARARRRDRRRARAAGRRRRRWGRCSRRWRVTAPGWPVPAGFGEDTHDRLSRRRARATPRRSGRDGRRASFTDTFGTLYAMPTSLPSSPATFGAQGLPAQIADPAYAIRLALAGGAIVALRQARARPRSRSTAPRDRRSSCTSSICCPSHKGTRRRRRRLMDWAIATARARGAQRRCSCRSMSTITAPGASTSAMASIEIGRYPFMVGDHDGRGRI